jgi:hypothetical protein
VAVEHRLRRLEGGSAQLCNACPYDGPVQYLESLRIVYPDGSEDVQRDPKDTTGEPVKLCGRCPYGPGGALQDEMPLGAIEVVRTVRVGEGDG